MIDRGVGLDRAVDEGFVAGLHGSTERANHAGSQRALESERIADGQHMLADLQRAGIADGQRGELVFAGIDLDQRHIVAHVRAHELGGKTQTVAERHFDGLRVFDHVIVGQNVTARIHHEAGARSFGRHRFHEHVVLHRARHDIRNRGRRCAVDPHVDGFVLAHAGSVRRRGRRWRRWHRFDAIRQARAPAAARPVTAQAENRAQSNQAQRARCRTRAVHGAILSSAAAVPSAARRFSRATSAETWRRVASSVPEASIKSSAMAFLRSSGICAAMR